MTSTGMNLIVSMLPLHLWLQCRYRTPPPPPPALPTVLAIEHASLYFFYQTHSGALHIFWQNTHNHTCNKRPHRCKQLCSTAVTTVAG